MDKLKKYCSIRMSLDLVNFISAKAKEEQRSFTGQAIYLIEYAIKALYKN